MNRRHFKQYVGKFCNILTVALVIIGTWIVTPNQANGQSKAGLLPPPYYPLRVSDTEKELIKTTYKQISEKISTIRLLVHQQKNSLAQSVLKEAYDEIQSSRLSFDDKKWLDREVNLAIVEAAKDVESIASYNILRANINVRYNDIARIDLAVSDALNEGDKLEAIKGGHFVGFVMVEQVFGSVSIIRFPKNLARSLDSVDWLIFRRRMPSCDVTHPANSLIGQKCVVSFNELISGKPFSLEMRVFAAELDRNGDIEILRLSSVENNEFSETLYYKVICIKSLRSPQVTFGLDQELGRLFLESEREKRMAIREQERKEREEAERIDAIRQAEAARKRRAEQVERDREADIVFLNQAIQKYRIVQVGNSDSYVPGPGYTWRNPSLVNNQAIPLRKRLEPQWTPGIRHSQHEHVISSDTPGQFVAETGYRFANEDKHDMTVIKDKTATSSITITPGQALTALAIIIGGAKIVSDLKQSSEANGSQASPPSSRPCPRCDGTGKLQNSNDAPNILTRKCPSCDGQGYL